MPGAAATGTMTALHAGNGPVGGEIATTRGVVAASGSAPARGSNTALLLVGGLGMAAFGAAAVLFALSRPARTGPAAGGATARRPRVTAKASPSATRQWRRRRA